MIGMPHLYGEECQMLLDITLYGERKFCLPTGYLTFSDEASVVGRRTCRPMARGE